MPLYREHKWLAPLQWSDVFEDSEEFVTKMEAVGTDDEHLDELYTILSNKYEASYTRYTEELPFILAIRRELQLTWPAYLMKKSLFETMKDMEIAEVMKSGSTLQNTVQTNDTPVVNADTIAISDLSTLQTNTNVLMNKLSAVLNKYEAMSNDYLQAIYDKTDGLFRRILSDDNTYFYPVEE